MALIHELIVLLIGVLICMLALGSIGRVHVNGISEKFDIYSTDFCADNEYVDNKFEMSSNIFSDKDTVLKIMCQNETDRVIYDCDYTNVCLEEDVWGDCIHDEYTFVCLEEPKVINEYSRYQDYMKMMGEEEIQ